MGYGVSPKDLFKCVPTVSVFIVYFKVQEQPCSRGYSRFIIKQLNKKAPQLH